MNRTVRAVLAAIAVVTIGVVGGCGERETSGGQSPAVAVPMTGTVTAGPPMGPPGTRPSTATDVSSDPLSPRSTHPSKAAYAYVYDPPDGQLEPAAYQYNSTGGRVYFRRVSAWDVTEIRLTGLGDPTGVAHVQSTSEDECFVHDLRVEGGDEVLTVFCGGPPSQTGPGGALRAEHAAYLLTFMAGSSGSARIGYAAVDLRATNARLVPLIAYDSVDPRGVTAARTAIGEYDLYFPSAGRQVVASWSAQVTGAGFRRCKASAFSPATAVLHISCRIGQQPADSTFVLTFSAGAHPLGRTDRPYATFERQDASRVSTGEYLVRLPGMGSPGGHATVTAYGPGPAFCRITRWQRVDADAEVSVGCYNPDRTPTDSDFLGAFTT